MHDDEPKSHGYLRFN